jgi:hypothetical protein
MPIIRVTKKQIEQAEKAREAARKEDPELSRHLEQLERLLREAAERQEPSS